MENQQVVLIVVLSVDRMRIFLLLNAFDRKAVVSPLWHMWLDAFPLVIETSDLVSFLFTVQLELLVDVAIFFNQLFGLLVALGFPKIFDGLKAIYAFQKVAIFVHVEGKLVICNRLNLLDW
jgi:hypothetical protein